MGPQDSTVSYRRNPNKPPETTQIVQSDLLLPELMAHTAVTLDPKSDEESGGISSSEPTSQSLADDSQSNSAHSRRQVLRRSSFDSDVSMLSRDSDDAPLIT